MNDTKPTSPEGANTPEMIAFYSNRPLMWRNLGLILFLNVGWSVCFTVIGPLLQLRLNKMGVGIGALGIISGINGWMYSYAVMYFAWKSDHTVSRFGRRIPYLFISAPIIILAITLFPFVDWVWLLVVLTLLQMLFTDIKAATIPLLNIDCMPRRMLARTGAPAAMIMGMVNFLAMRYGMKLSDWSETMPYLIAGGILATTTLVGGFLIKEPPVKNPTTEKFRPWSAMGVAWKKKRTIILMIAVSLFQTYQTVYWAWIWLYAKNALQLSRTETGLTVSWAILVSVVLSFPMGWVIDRVSPYKILPVYCGLAGVALWFLLHITSPAYLIVAASLVALVAALYPAADIMVYRNAHPKEIGSVTSTNSCLRGFYNGCLGITAGFLIEKTGGHYDYAFILAFILTCFGLVPLFIYRHLSHNASESVPTSASELSLPEPDLTQPASYR